MMSTRFFVRALASVYASLWIVAVSNAYEVTTHAVITREAIALSYLGKDTNLLTQLGLDKRPYLLGNVYLDINGNQVLPRNRDPFEIKVMTDAYIEPKTIASWIATGAIREDDVPSDKKIPQNDPYNSNLYRVFNHFFDPYYNRGLDTFGTCIYLQQCDIHKAPDWAVGSLNSFASPNTPEGNRQNHFTVFDAREAMYRALTLRQQTAPGVFANLPEATNPSLVVRENTRKAYWATTFRSLGDILHLNQDMAQPQHTRNEPHSGQGFEFVQTIATGHASVYENYIDLRAGGKDEYEVDGTTVSVTKKTAAKLEFTDYPEYPIPKFPKYTDYWSTSPGTASLSGKGLADYSSRGFFTAARNVYGTEYPSPDPNPNNPRYSPQDTTYVIAGIPNLKLRYLKGRVPDTLTNQVDLPITMATQGIWPTAAGSSQRTYLLTRQNYDDMASLLLPRAVSYSAGLINHFFRGQMQISAPQGGVYGFIDHADITGINDSTSALSNNKGFDKIKLNLANSTPATDGSGGLEPMVNGQLEAVIKFYRNQCYKDDLSGMPGAPGIDALTCRADTEDIVVSTAITAVTLTATPQAFTFIFPAGKALPLNATDVRLQVVYRGPLGQEADAVVVATKDISEPSFYTLMNTMDYVHIDNTVKTRAEIDASPTLLNKLTDQTCVNRTVSPIRLKDSCFQPTPITATLDFGAAAVRAQVIGLPPLEYVRVALLIEPAVALPVQMLSAGFETIANPLDALVWQGDYDEINNVISVTYSDLYSLRGAWTWDSIYLTWLGDLSTVGPSDDYTLMTPLNQTAGFTPTLKPVKMMVTDW